MQARSPIEPKKPHFFSRLAGAFTGLVLGLVKPVFTIPYRFFSNLFQNIGDIATQPTVLSGVALAILSIPMAVMGAVFNIPRTIISWPLTLAKSIALGWNDGFVAALKSPYLEYLSLKINSLSWNGGLTVKDGQVHLSPKVFEIIKSLRTHYPASLSSAEALSDFFLKAISYGLALTASQPIQRAMERTINLMDRLALAKTEEIQSNTPPLTDEEKHQIQARLNNYSINKKFAATLSASENSITFEDSYKEVSVYRSEQDVLIDTKADFMGGTFYRGFSAYLSGLIDDVRLLLSQKSPAQDGTHPLSPARMRPSLTISLSPGSNRSALYGDTNNTAQAASQAASHQASSPKSQR